MSNGKRDNHPATLERNGQAVQFHGNGSGKVGALIDNAPANLTQDQAHNLSAIAAEEGLRLEVKIREQYIDYTAGKKTMEDHIEVFVGLDKQGKLTRQKVVSDIKTGAGNMRIESTSGATCFVATATYGGADHPNVRFLRSFRDNCLVLTPAGRAFVDWYWRTGPRLASWVERSAILKWASRCTLSVLVLMIKAVWRK